MAELSRREFLKAASAAITTGALGVAELSPFSQAEAASEKGAKQRIGEVISLPKGGGALRGIGETFKADLFTGTANFSFPVVTSPGREGFGPSLTLQYSSGNGNGLFGIGWALSVPDISRKTEKGVPRYTSEDIFLLSGWEDLVEALNPAPRPEGNFFVRTFRPRVEGLFARIERWERRLGNSVAGWSDVYWKITTKDGVTNLYGRTASATVVNRSSASANEKHFQWLLELSYDLKGNYVRYEYDIKYGPEDLKEIFEERRQPTQSYLKRIFYGNLAPFDPTRASAAEDLLTRPPALQDEFFMVVLDYGEHGTEDTDGAERIELGLHEGKKPVSRRPDPFSSNRAGFELRTYRRCKRVLMFHNAVPSEGDPATGKPIPVLVKSTDLLYREEPHTKVSFLVGVIQRGYRKTAAGGPFGSEDLPGYPVVRSSIYEIQSLAPLTFAYTQFAPEGQKFQALRSENDDWPHALNAPNYALVDLFGAGLPDIVHTTSAGFFFWRNLGAGKLAVRSVLKQAPTGVSLDQEGVGFGDMAGDGRADLLVHQGAQWGYFETDGKGGWSPIFRKYKRQPSFKLQDPNVRLVDLTGDGKADVMRTDLTHFTIFPCLGPEGFGEPVRRVRKFDLDRFPNVSFQDPRVRLADMTGDGLQDIVYVGSGRIDYWASRGHGDWSERMTMKTSPRFGPDFDPKRLFLVDVDGNGTADLVYVESGQVRFWLNQSGNSWSEEQVIYGTPVVTDLDSVQPADMLGNGTQGLLYSTTYRGPGRSNYWFLDLTGGVKPYVLAEMANNMGTTTKVQYSTSSREYLDDLERGKPWRTSLPFPVQVLKKVEVVDHFAKSKLVAIYSYHHGYYDGREREFRGFGRVDHQDTETFDRYHGPGLHPAAAFTNVKAGMFSPPLETRTWFHQGSIESEREAWRESDFTSEFWSHDPNVLADVPYHEISKTTSRDAVRALRGQILRSELYGLDGSEWQSRPYTVNEYLHGVRDEDGQGSLGTRPRIFFPYTLAERTTQWERGNDPMHQFVFTEEFDEFGQARKQTKISCPRGWRTLDDAPSADYLATTTQTDFATKGEAATRYVRDRVARATTFQLKDTAGKKVAEIKDASGGVSIVSQTLHFYDGPEFVGLPYQEIGKFAALVRTESLVLTKEIIEAAYGSEAPLYLTSSNPTWQPEYPAEFQAGMSPRAGYIERNGVSPSYYAPGYFVAADRRRYDFHENATGARGLVTAARDPLGNLTVTSYDAFGFYPTEVKNTAQLKTTALYDYQRLQPAQVIDPNDGRKLFTFTPVGLLKEIWTRGHNNEGDQQRASVQMEYDLCAFLKNTQPSSIATIRHLHNDTDTNVPQPERDKTIQSVEYSDGFGRVLQMRTQAEDVVFGALPLGDSGLAADQLDPGRDAVGKAVTARVVVSGWQTYDNKGRVVEKYEPFFADGWVGLSEATKAIGQKALLFYDARGQLVRTINPDLSEQAIIQGIPLDLDKPDKVIPTPWEAYTYDANDNAGGTHPAESLGYRHHWNTPSSVVIDALGRTVQVIERNRASPPSASASLAAIDEVSTGVAYDIRGNLVGTKDALGRQALRYTYDLSNRPLRVESVDGGIRVNLADAAGNRIEERDSKGALILRVYDCLNRPSRLWARDQKNESVTLRERFEYGDGCAAQNAPAENLQKYRLGKLHKHYDEAGLRSFERYDFRGNILEKARRIIKDSVILSTFSPAPSDWKVKPFRVSWQPPTGIAFQDHADGLLDSTVYQTSLTYDALNRIKTMHYPQDVTGARKVLTSRYNSAGALQQLVLDGTSYVEHIAYNARGQRILIAYGNGTMTRSVYSQKMFRVARTRTESYSKTTASTYHPIGPVRQDVGYEYDRVGNIITIFDRTPECGVAAQPHRLDRVFKYDPLYRVVSATGRECDMPSTQSSPWEDKPRCQDHTQTRTYTQAYTYDNTSNLTELHHYAGSTGSFSRNLPVETQSNRLGTVTTGSTTIVYGYDLNGNLLDETKSRHYEWDHSDRLRVFRTQVVGSEPSSYGHYLYDPANRRVMTLVRRQGGQSTEVTVYIDGVFEHHRVLQGGEVAENNILHVMDNEQRIAAIRTGVAFTEDLSPSVKYLISDHLGGSNVVINETGSWINREEYYPYGETSFGSFAKKRYRFTGKERDAESALSYHEARYYAPWLARWMSPDPLPLRISEPAYSNGVAVNPYVYARGNAIVYLDSSGLSSSKSSIPTGTPQIEGMIAHDIILPELQKRLEQLGYQVDINLLTLPGGSATPGSKAKGKIDLAIFSTGSGTQEYDLKPWGKSLEARYQRQIFNYVVRTDTGLRTAIGRKLTEIVRAHPDVLDPVEAGGGSSYELRLPPDPTSGEPIPGFIEYRKVKERKAADPVPVPVLIPLRKDAKDQNRFQEMGRPLLVPSPARAQGPAVGPKEIGIIITIAAVAAYAFYRAFTVATGLLFFVSPPESDPGKTL